MSKRKRSRSQHPPTGQHAPTAGGVTIAIPPVEEVRVAPAWWTGERVLYGLLALAALLLRFLWLDGRPLSPAEAHQAWLAWRNTQPLPHAAVVDVSPAMYSLQWLLFLLTGGSDALARFWAALAGVGLVLLPYGLRERIGRERAWLAALLLAFSTQAVYWGRHATGLSLTLFAGLGLLVALVWAVAPQEGVDMEEARRRRTVAFTWAALALALLIASDAVAYTVLVGVGVGLWAWRKELADAWEAIGGKARHRVAGAFLLALALAGSAFLTDIPALGSVSDLVGRWLAGFWQGAGYPWYWVFFRLLADEPLLVVLAVWGAWRAWQRGDALDRVWLGWLGVGLVFAVARMGRTSADVALLVVPLAFLAAAALEEVVRVLRAPSPTWREEMVLTAAFFVILGFWFMMMAGYIRVGEPRYVPALFAVPLLLVFLSVVYGYWLGRRATVRVALATLLITGVIWSWMAMWVQNLHLAEDAALDALPGIERTTTHPNIRLMERTLERISAQTTTDLHEVAVDAVLRPEDDVLRWYLRDFKNLREVASVKAATAPVVITHRGDAELPGYTGMDWLVTRTQLPSYLGNEMGHWWLYREASLGDTGSWVILWYRKP